MIIEKSLGKALPPNRFTTNLMIRNVAVAITVGVGRGGVGG